MRQLVSVSNHIVARANESIARIDALKAGDVEADNEELTDSWDVDALGNETGKEEATEEEEEGNSCYATNTDKKKIGGGEAVTRKTRVMPGSSNSIDFSQNETSMKLENLTIAGLNDPDIVNSLRLCLTWIGEGNFLIQKSIHVSSATELSSVKISAGSSSFGERLTESHLKELMPREVAWKLVTHGSKIYDSKFSDERKGQSFQVLEPLLIAASAKDVMQVSIIEQPGVSAGENPGYILLAVDTRTLDGQRCRDSILCSYQPGQFSRVGLCSHAKQYELYVFIGPLKGEVSLFKDLEHRLADSYFSLLIPTVGTPKLTACDSSLDEDELHNIFCGPNCAERSPIAVQVLHSSQVLIFPPPGETRFPETEKEKNERLEKEKTIAEKKQQRQDCGKEGTNAGGNKLMAALGLKVAAAPIQRDGASAIKAAIEQHNSDGGSGSGITAKPKGCSPKSNKTEPDTRPIDEPLLTDLPVGMRILNACRQGHVRQRSLKLRRLLYLQSTEEDQKRKNSNNVSKKGKEAVPGSVEWALAHFDGTVKDSSATTTTSSVIKADAIDKYVPTGKKFEEDIPSFEVNLSLISPAWMNVRAIGRAPGDTSDDLLFADDMEDGTDHHQQGLLSECPAAVLSQQSHIGVAAHCVGKASHIQSQQQQQQHSRPFGELEDLFAVCASSMTIGAGGGTVKCDGVTLLPPGSRWVTLALGCIGLQLGDIVRKYLFCSTPSI